MRYLLVLLIAVAMAGPARAAELSPPEGAHLVGSDSTFTFSWPGPPGDYLFSVSAGGRVLGEQAVKGNTLVLRLPPNCLYRWKVSPTGGTGFKDTGEIHSFQHQSVIEYHFDGVSAAPSRRVGEPGQVRFGAYGAPGKHVRVDLAATSSELINVTIQADNATTRFLLMPSSTPLWITARGGPGTDGRPGRDGVLMNSVQSGDGEPGGRGGNGGDGGQIMIHCERPAWQRLVKADAGGGPEGKGGAGGRAGITYGTQIRGSAGAAGVDGKPGKDGDVLRS